MSKRPKQISVKPAVPEAEHKPLPWKYCECGCHRHIVSIGSLSYSLYNDLNGKFLLSSGHSSVLNANLGTFSSFAEADRHVRALAEPEIKRKRKELRATERALARV